MRQGIVNRTKKELDRLKEYLREHADELTEEEVNELLERIGSLVELLEILDGS